MDDAAAALEPQDVPSRPPRAAALIEVLLCSGFPTQLLIIGLLRLIGMHPSDGAGGLSLAFFGTIGRRLWI